MTHEIRHKLAAALGELLMVTTMDCVSRRQIDDTKKYVRELLTTDEAGIEYWVPQELMKMREGGIYRVHLYSGRIEKIRGKHGFDPSAQYYQLRTMDQAMTLCQSLTGQVVAQPLEFVDA